jgi:hypothetical protein
MPSVCLYISMYECEPRQPLNCWTNYISSRFIRMYSLQVGAPSEYEHSASSESSSKEKGVF